MLNKGNKNYSFSRHDHKKFSIVPVKKFCDIRLYRAYKIIASSEKDIADVPCTCRVTLHVISQMYFYLWEGAESAIAWKCLGGCIRTRSSCG